MAPAGQGRGGGVVGEEVPGQQLFWEEERAKWVQADCVKGQRHGSRGQASLVQTQKASRRAGQFRGRQRPVWESTSEVKPRSQTWVLFHKGKDPRASQRVCECGAGQSTHHLASGDPKPNSGSAISLSKFTSLNLHLLLRNSLLPAQPWQVAESQHTAGATGRLGIPSP